MQNKDVLYFRHDKKKLLKNLEQKLNAIILKNIIYYKVQSQDMLNLIQYLVSYSSLLFLDFYNYVK